MPRRRLTSVAVLVLAALSFARPAAASGDPDVAALQVALGAHGLYSGTVDGIAGPATVSAVRALQRRAGIAVDGVAGPQTRAALGPYGSPDLGDRALAAGAVGWDVAALQYLLAWHGFPSGTIDGHFTRRTEAALRRYQRWAGLPDDGVAGPAVLASLGSPVPRSPLVLSRPLDVSVSDRFGPRGARFHAGIDFPAASGTAVAAAGAGRVAYAGWHPGGWGYLVTIAHGSGVRTMYAHLSRVDVRVGQRLAAGAEIGRVGSSGISTGPHLHFEVRLRVAAVDPFTAFR